MSIEKLRDIFKQNEDAIQLVLMVREISHTWDDLIDKDKPVSEAQIHRAFWLALVGLRTNNFYRQFESALLPVMETGILNFVASVELERWPGRSRELAHTARYAAGDIALVITRLIGGLDWAMQHAPELKLMLQQDDFASFNSEMEAKYGTDSTQA